MNKDDFGNTIHAHNGSSKSSILEYHHREICTMAPKAPASTTSAKQSAISKPSKSTTSGRVKKPKSTPKTTTSKPKAPAKKAEKPVSAASNKRKKDDSENEEAAQDRAVKRTKKTVVKNKTAQAKTATKTTTQRITSSNVIDEMKSTAGTGSVVISGTKDKETAAFEPQRSHNMQADTVSLLVCPSHQYRH